MHGTPNYSHENIVIEFTNGSFISVFQSKQTKGLQNTIFSFRSPYRYNSTLKVLQSTATSEIRLNNYGASGASDLDAKMEENYRRIHAMFNKYMFENDCKPSEAAAKIIGDLNASISKCLGLEIFSIGNIDESEGCLYFTKIDHPRKFDFNVLSSGEKEIVDILLDLYLRKNEYSDTIFLLDEPELHINTSIQKNLLIEIDKLIGNDCQIWITTHSIGFLRTIQGEMKDKCQIIQFKSDYKLASTSFTLTPMTSSRSNWRDIFSVALDDLAHLVSPKRIVYCEGRSDYVKNAGDKGLDAQVFNNIFGSYYTDTLFVSSGGNTELDQRSVVAIAILGKVYEDLEILVLKDRDMASGKSTTENDRQTYLLNNASNHRVLKRWEIENYLYDKDVLKKFCLENEYDFDESAYDALITCIENQNLKDITSKIKNICGINTSVNAEIFKKNISKIITKEMSVFSELEKCIFDRK